jgi:hypothetical protein
MIYKKGMILMKKAEEELQKILREYEDKKISIKVLKLKLNSLNVNIIKIISFFIKSVRHFFEKTEVFKMERWQLKQLQQLPWW